MKYNNPEIYFIYIVKYKNVEIYLLYIVKYQNSKTIALRQKRKLKLHRWKDKEKKTF